MAKSRVGRYLERRWKEGGTMPSGRRASASSPKAERKPARSRNAATKTHTARYPKKLRSPGRRGKSSGGVKPRKQVNWKEV